MARLQKKWKITDWIGLEALFLYVFVFANKALVYDTSRLLAEGKYHADLSSPFESFIPLVPWMVWIYFGCYLIWFFNYALSMRYDKTEAIIFAGADLLGEWIAFLFFVFFPTTMVRPEVVGTGLSDRFLSFPYLIDAPDNLFPSLHCFNSWLSWIGIRKNPQVPEAYKWFSFLFALLTWFCALAVKQHVLVDTFAGIALAELSYLLSSWLVPKFKRK